MKKKEKTSMGYLVDFAMKYKGRYFASIILAILGVICSIVPYFYISKIITGLLSGVKDLSFYVNCCVIMAVLWTVRVLMHSFSTTFSHKATFNVLGDIRKACLEKMGRMSLGDIEKRPSGELKNILVERIDSIETTLAHILPEFTSNLLGSLAVCIFLFFLNWKLALVSLITFPVGILCFMGMMIGYEESYKRVINSVKNLNDTAVEYIGGIEVIKVFGKTKSSYERFLAAAKEGAACYIDWMRQNNLYFSFFFAITPATLITVLPVGAIMVRHGTLLPETFILMIVLSMGLITPIITCMSYSDDIAKLQTVLDEVMGILEEKDMERPEKDSKKPADNTVEFKDVHFGYNEKEVLHGIDLTFKEGKVSALVGPSGSGKSTIAKLLASYWDAKSGKITVGNVDIKDLSLDEYYKKVAYVSQDNFLFDDTVMENIRMGNPDATDEDVINACKACSCHDFIMGLEKGYDTMAGGEGGHLSGGERQRIAIARAMLKNAPIIILDEATAYTDPENEAIIQESVAKLIKGKTLIVIAHRLSTIKDADCIYVINDGNVDSFGTHEELLSMDGLYKKMWLSHISSKDALEGGKANV